jgi:hypothetical protein
VAVILRFDGLRVVIYPNDHRPAHVHIQGKGCEAVFVLHCPGGPPRLRESYGFKLPELGRLAAMIADNLAMLCEEWSVRHGRY